MGNINEKVPQMGNINEKVPQMGNINEKVPQMGKKKKRSKKIGRPSTYSEKTADLICALIADGKSLRTIEKVDGMPRIVTMFEWLRKYDMFANQYARAKEEQAEALAEEILDISDDDTEDYGFDQHGKPIFLQQNFQRSRLRVDSRKWIASKLKPKKYGERQTIEHEGTVKTTVNFVVKDKSD